jgi:NaMN:DMB phosphoribosyltransferase
LNTAHIYEKYKCISTTAENLHDQKKGMLNAIKTQKIDNYILKDDVFAAISYFGNPIILTVAGRCEGEITCS